MNIMQRPVCELTEKEFKSLPGFGAAQILNQLSGEIIIDVARYSKSKIIVFIYEDEKEQFWQPYFVEIKENEK